MTMAFLHLMGVKVSKRDLITATSPTGIQFGQTSWM